MIAARAAMIVVAAACWDGWRLLAGRIDDVSAAVLAAAMIGVTGWRFVAIGGAAIRSLPVAAMLAGYALTCLTGPALFQIGAAVGVLMLMAFHGATVPRLPLAGLAALLLPVLPTLDFLLAYPLRRVSAAITVALLRLNGVEVSVNGIALEWQGQSLLFDGPCSGVRMLWAALVLASLVALAGRHAPFAYARLLAMATAIAVVGNSLRAASLFYVENGYVERLQGPVAHETVGVVAFALVAVAVIAVPRLRWRAA